MFPFQRRNQLRRIKRFVASFQVFDGQAPRFHVAIAPASIDVEARPFSFFSGLAHHKPVVLKHESDSPDSARASCDRVSLPAETGVDLDDRITVPLGTRAPPLAPGRSTAGGFGFVVADLVENQQIRLIRALFFTRPEANVLRRL